MGLKKHEITEKRNSELKELNTISKLKVMSLTTDKVRLENENKDLRVTDQTLRKENEAIGIGNKELYKKVEILNKKIDDLKRVEHRDVREPDSYEVIQHRNVESSQERELEDKICNLNHI